MASELNYDKLVQLVRKERDITQKGAADKLGLSIGQVSMLKFCQAQVEAGAYTKQPGNAQSIKRMRDSEGNRWELIAARTGLSVAAVKDKYPGDASSSYTGRGRNFANGGGSGRKPAGRKPAGRKPAGRKPAGRSGGSKPSGRKPGAKPRGRTSITRTVRGGRRSTAGNPS